MKALDELVQVLAGPSRVVVIAKNDVNLQTLTGDNHLFLLVLMEGSLAAGGRGGGFGERRVVRVLHFRYADGSCEKLYDSSDSSTVSSFEVPFHVARMPMTLHDVAENMCYGVVDPELVSEFIAKTASPP